MANLNLFENTQEGKRCTKCGGVFPISNFNKCRGNLRAYCKQCHRTEATKWQRANAGKYRLRAEKWRRSKGIMPPKPKAPEYIRLAKRTAAQRKWREENPEAMKLARAEWAAANPHKAAEICRARQARKAQACPAWVDREALAKFYKLARDMTRETGVKHCVDHIVPLKNKIVCGLHVPANLQVITVSENARKGNSFVES